MKVKIALTLLAALLLVTGCSRKANEQVLFAGSSLRAMPAAQDEMASITLEDSFRQTNSPDFSLSANLSNIERKLIKRAHLTIRVENLLIADSSVFILLEKYNAYSASTSIDENSHYYSLRIPSVRYDSFLAEMNGIGRLLHRSENTEDVTLRYFDLEGRLESKRELLRTFQAYLGRANNIEEILSVEARIAELQFDIENTGTQLRHLANMIDYATIDLFLLGPVAAQITRNETFSERVKKLFSGFNSFLSSVAVIFLGFVIYGIPSLALLTLLFWLLFGKIGLARKLWSIIRK
jgi:hypothetical protein